MSFGQIETTRSLGQPDTLYRFTMGSTVFAYTDAEQPITASGVTYQPIPIARDAVTTSGSLDKSSMKIKVPHDCEISQLFAQFPPSTVVSVAVFQGHSDDPEHEYLAIYVGRVVSRSCAKTTATLNCEPVSTSMNRPGLTKNWMYGCPLALYSCGVNRDDFSWNRTVTAVAKGKVTLADGWEGSYAAAKFVNGLAEWTHDGGRVELRTILQASAVTNVIVVGGATDGLVVGGTIKLSLGCNHLLLNGGDCGAVFNNAPNYGGAPWIPTNNPIGFVNRFY